ncbi:Vacuolar protein sorting-associated protein 33A [Zancudomyces culisetae]|uniref:Vacuolar protein sorting-associated protein 33A n=1 Tax=Zancudomyces culisetae TaxID=1213189 RepID=A0A1R1PUW8_ZANCU|nr:Vacuolar protein sorting-associated protein 33A [Zancudomyces culisetae]|eukprot:OMH84723.1 Vacuolar protein sorting-associated protein 33A [Zancudomyces culisetae]
MQAEQHSLQTHVVLAKQLVEFTQSEEFIKINEIEASLIEFSDLTKEQLQYIEELITKCDPFFMDEESHRNHNKLAIVLRIVCLYSLIKGPKVKRKYFEKFYSLIIGAMGFQHAITLKRLSRLEIFEPPAPSTSFASTLFFSRSFTNPSAQSSTPSSGSGYNSTTKNVGGGSGTKGNGDLLDDEGLSALPSTKPSNPSTSDTFSFLRTSLKLYPNAHPHSADDVGKFYNGYVPISIRLIQCLTRDNKILSDYNSNAKSSYVGINVGFNSNINRDSDSGLNVPGGVVFGWKGFEDILQNIPGKTVELIQYSSSTSLLQPAYSDPPSSNTTPVKSTLLFFLGGITLAEISAIRYLSQKQNHNYIIATTDIINGNSLINSIMDV